MWDTSHRAVQGSKKAPCGVRLLGERGGDGEPLMAPGCTAELVGPVEVVNYMLEEA